MKETTYSKYQNFNNEIDQEKEAQTIAEILELETVDQVEDLYILSYRKLLEEGDEPTREDLESYYDYLYWVVVYKYNTNDLEALQKSPFDYVSTNYNDLYDEQGDVPDISKPLIVNLGNCYIINNRTYEII